ncbi:putative Mg2+ transporter Zinc transport protein [Rosellinia necatrix]|uniref:Putative Mg2+ transporter Zinc transport protein n=1 Tax=Rosellinia necatrix TaxID=77044 RepID=A0A1W2TI17_ROSNE|nr:putative Mg2+ transporter Zinc transport protein [Rosellinia necatrix]
MPPQERGGDSWWRPELKGNDYDLFGDAYDDKAYRTLASAWKIDVAETPYLKWVRELSDSGWIHLRLLVDFMSIGAAPQHWRNLDTVRASGENLLNGEDITRRRDERKRRIARTKVSILDYFPDSVEKVELDCAQDLQKHLDEDSVDDAIQFRLYVVEDLSRDVIEAFGDKFKIEPDFFRAHIVDFAWYNVRDRWRNPPLLDIVSRHQNWMQLRYVTARYFDFNEKSSQKEQRSSFTRAAEQAAGFNILRRVDDDLSNKSYWDKQGAIVGLSRSRATFWLQPDSPQQTTQVGILLLDPTVTEGVPLWRGRRTLWPMPQYGQEVPSRPPDGDNLFDHFVFWAQQTNLYPNCTTENPLKTLIPIQVLLHFVCSEWLTMSDYIKTRLNQLDWEIVKPEFFRLGKKGVNNMLEKLHVFRRLVPLYREMVSETIRHLDQFSGRIQVQEPTTPCSRPWDTPHISISHYKSDLAQVKSQLEEYQGRIDQLTSVVTAVISIDNSRRSLQDNRNIGRLTWLATLFIPLSLVAGIFSMQPNVSEISRYTFAVYFATSLPLGVVIAVAAFTLSLYQSKTQNKLDKLRGAVRSLWARQKHD